ncbi:MAG: hypothetical protein KIT10_13105 [Flavobacteriales bacterium]|nr:hypothetical protein [Flavobacteriales bacterium]
MKRLLLLPLLTSVTLLPAQVVLIQPGPDDPGELRFNPQFIARNRIHTITGEQSVKRDNRPMLAKPEKHVYRFDEQGRTAYSNHSFGQPGSGRDTASTMFTFDEQGDLVRRLRNDLSGYFGFDVVRDEQGRPVRETFTRIENLSTNRYELRPGAITEISDEHFRYETVNDTVWKRMYINSLGLPYREQTHTSDRLGYLRSIEDRYLVNNRRSRITFDYDEKGRLAGRTEQPDLSQPRTLRRTWKYDAAGNVTDGALFHDDKQINRDEYLYEENGMLKARLTLDIGTNNIEVLRFRTERR